VIFGGNFPVGSNRVCRRFACKRRCSLQIFDEKRTNELENKKKREKRTVALSLALILTDDTSRFRETPMTL
jgi:hypothetical protein